MCCGAFVDRPAGEIGERHAAASDHGDLAVVEEHDFACVRQNRGDVGGDEELAVAEPDDHRRAVADGDDRLGIVGGDQHQREQALDARQRPAHRRRQPIVASLLLDQMRDDFGVGLGEELVARRLQLPLELEVVLDDAVVDDDHAFLAVAMRMRVLFGRPPVGRPARVTDPEFALNRIAREHVAQVLELAGAAANLQLTVADERDTRRVVAAIFEAMQTVHQTRAEPVSDPT